jgi:hypothetical protein
MLLNVTKQKFNDKMGAVVAAKFSRDLRLSDVIMKGDSLIVTQALKNVGPNWSPYELHIEDAQGILFTRRSWLVNHVKREVNLAAHYLAKDAFLFRARLGVRFQ